MNENASLSKFRVPTRNVIGDTIQHIAEGVTGIAASDRRDLVLSLGHIFQRLRRGEFLTTLLNEWERFKNNGRIKDDYEFTEQHQSCLSELLRYLETGIPDEKIFDVLKRIFIVAATESSSERNDFLPQQYMAIASSLTAGEVLILNAAYTYSSIARNEGKETINTKRWMTYIAANSPVTHYELVAYHLNDLYGKHLSSANPERVGDVLGRPYFGLTELGYAFCDFVHKYDDLKT